MKTKDYLRELTHVIVSAAAIFISYQSYIISKNQLAVSNVSVEPHFYIDSIPVLNPTNNELIEEKLIIYNIGAPAANIKTTIRTFYELNSTKPSTKIWIPLDGYYLASVPTKNPRGIIATHIGDKNSTKDYELTVNYSGEDIQDDITISLKQVAYISYITFDDEEKNVCFLNMRKTNCDNVAPYKELMYKDRVDINKVTYKELIEKYYLLVASSDVDFFRATIKQNN
ncbi:hypothetical protein [Aeromonas hydrophila]